MLQLLVFAALGYGGVVASLYFAQGWLVFPGSALSYGASSGPLVAERVELRVDDEVMLEGQLFRAEGARDLVIGFGGNAQDAGLLGQDLAARLPGVNVAVFHYRGYGPSGLVSSKTGRPDGLSGNVTESTLAQFKSTMGLPADAIVDSATWQFLIAEGLD